MFSRARRFPDSVVNGFSDRKGGSSVGRYASLNLGQKWGDDPSAVAENYRRLAGEAGFSLEDLRTITQVHGAALCSVTELGPKVEGDGLYALREESPRAVLGIMTADCVPLLLSDRRGEAIAAVHSGWRGTVAEIAKVAVGRLEERGFPPSSLVAAIGPCIEVGAFEVGEEVASQFADRFVLREKGRRPHVDLVAALRSQLEEAGLEPNQIERVGGCTHANEEHYFSYRRDGAGIGQHLSFVGFRSDQRSS